MAYIGITNKRNLPNIFTTCSSCRVNCYINQNNLRLVCNVHLNLKHKVTTFFI